MLCNAVIDEEVGPTGWGHAALKALGRSSGQACSTTFYQSIS